MDAQRPSSRERLYTKAWEKARAAYLRAHPLCMCEECDEGRKRLTAATVVDHKMPHRGDRALFWDSSNWQSMAKACHDRKTAREDGGFGNAVRGDVDGVGGRNP
jgi:5-methylcytosine-specific restriction protein A